MSRVRRLNDNNMPDNFIHRTCPVCRGDAASGPVVSSEIDTLSLSFDELRQYWYGFFKEKAFFPYYRCKNCRTLYCREYFDTGGLIELYRNMPENMSDVPADAISRTQRGYFEVLKKFSAFRGGYLEIGPDTGTFTGYCADGGFDKFYLFEPNEAVHEKLRGTVSGRHYGIYNDMFDYGAVPDGAISTCVMIHVLDHILEPAEMLKELRKKMMKSGSILFIVTHDESSLLARVVKGKWPAYCLQHPQLFSPPSMKALMGAAGYGIIKVVKSYNYFPLMYLIKHLLWAAGLKSLPVPAGGMIQLPLKLGNIITIAAPDIG